MSTKKGFAAGFVVGALAGTVGALALYKKRRHLKKLWWRFEAKQEIYKRLRRGKRLTRAFYEEVIDAVLARYGAAGDVAEEELEAFGEKLKEKYAAVRAELAEAAGEAAQKQEEEE